MWWVCDGGCGCGVAGWVGGWRGKAVPLVCCLGPQRPGRGVGGWACPTCDFAEDPVAVRLGVGQPAEHHRARALAAQEALPRATAPPNGHAITSLGGARPSVLARHHCTPSRTPATRRNANSSPSPSLCIRAARAPSALLCLPASALGTVPTHRWPILVERVAGRALHQHTARLTSSTHRTIRNGGQSKAMGCG